MGLAGARQTTDFRVLAIVFLRCGYSSLTVRALLAHFLLHSDSPLVWYFILSSSRPVSIVLHASSAARCVHVCHCAAVGCSGGVRNHPRSVDGLHRVVHTVVVAVVIGFQSAMNAGMGTVKVNRMGPVVFRWGNWLVRVYELRIQYHSVIIISWLLAYDVTTIDFRLCASG